MALSTPGDRPKARKPRTVINADWLDLCQRSKSGPLANTFNVVVALQHDPTWVGHFAFDQISKCTTNSR